MHHPGDEFARVTQHQEIGTFRPHSIDCPADSQIAGVAATAIAPAAGEWCPKGVRVRRNSLLRRRRRAGGGAMVRKATLDRSLQPDELAAADEVVPGVTESAELTQPRPQHWRGSGGRWLVWTFRAVLWAVLLIVGFRGVVSIATSSRAPGSAGSSAPAVATSNGFPVGLAEAFALQFGNVYLNFSPAAAAQRASELTPFIPVGSDPQFGWNGAGSQQLQSEQVASISVQNENRAVVTLLAQVNSGLVELAVPIYSGQGGLVVSAEPALLPGPERADPPSASSVPTDPATTAALTDQLPGFFRAYANGDQEALGRFLAPGAVVTGLGGAVTFGSISGMEVPSGGATRRITVSVVWQFASQATSKTRDRQSANDSSVDNASAGLEMTYEMTVVQQNGSWYVKAIGPSALQPEAP
jgi:Conjugative transposon protein TcpC